MNRYYPEGVLLKTPENYMRISSLSGLEKAQEKETILEATAILCDESLALHVELAGGLRGVIPKEEVVLSKPNESVKDIAILTRVGKPVCFCVTGFLREGDGQCIAILSRRKAQRLCVENYIANLIPGDIIPARVTHMEGFGAFMDIGCGIPSLLTIDAISVSRISHPKERFAVGDEMKVAVKSKDAEGRVYLTRKELLGTWEENASIFEPGQTVAGIVRSIENYGIFVELTPNLAGLAELKEGVAPGDIAAVFIKSILPEKMKVKLVIIDSQPSKIPFSFPAVHAAASKEEHLCTWRYSPDSCNRVIETFF